jgi:hypothetical protein
MRTAEALNPLLLGLDVSAAAVANLDTPAF